jgi:threonine/homoserine/homoserine lactone efflux protein
MPSIETISVFVLASFVLVAIPSPSVLFVVNPSVSLGRRAALLTIIGNTGGLYTQAQLVAVGLGALVVQSVLVYVAGAT